LALALYSPDLTLSVFFLFGFIKGQVKGKHGPDDPLLLMRQLDVVVPNLRDGKAKR
jgi:hypothetical protein